MADPAAAASRSPSSVRISGISKAFGSTPVLRGVDASVPDGSVLALLGPSGCGKTTLLRIVAGLEAPEAGEIRVGDETLSSGRHVVPPERRRLGMVFQDWALFPHMSVADNVAYGLPRSRRSSSRTDEVLALVGLGGFGRRSPTTLSGGQQQRVALARALAPEPRVLLLDEPFSNLDATLRAQLRSEIRQLLADLAVTTIFVTHDQDEAFLLGDEVAVMQDGRVVQQARPEELYAHPASRWVASFVGEANLLPARASGERADTAIGAVPLVQAQAGSVDVLVRPEAVGLSTGTGAVVAGVEFYGHDCVYRLELAAGTRIRARVASAPAFRPGDSVALRYVGPPTVAYPAGAPSGNGAA